MTLSLRINLCFGQKHMSFFKEGFYCSDRAGLMYGMYRIYVNALVELVHYKKSKSNFLHILSTVHQLMENNSTRLTLVNV